MAAEGDARIRVLVVDDHELVRKGVRALLDRVADIEVVGEARDGREAIEMSAALHPDVVLMDISMPNVNGIDATRAITSARGGSQVVALSMHTDEEHVMELLMAGARGFLIKDAPPVDMVDAIRHVREGHCYLHPRVTSPVIRSRLEEGGRVGAVKVPARFTRRELEVLRLIREGHTNKEIARILGRSIKTIETHRSSLMAKSGARNVAMLIFYALSHDLLRII